MKSLTKQQLKEILPYIYVLLEEETFKVYGVSEVNDLTFTLTSDDGPCMICCNDGARLEDRNLSVIDSEGKERAFQLLLLNK